MEDKINKDFDYDAVYVSGPINVFRMEGQIGSVKKVIYLFMDLHMSVTEQTECTNIYSKDVNRFFAENFRNMNDGDKMYDFFLEHFPTYIANKTYDPNNKYIYIIQIRKLFDQIFKFDAEKNKVNINEQLKNIRLHYLDIRDYLKHYLYIPLSNFINYFDDAKTQNLNPFILKDVIDILTKTKNNLDKTLSIISDPNYKPINSEKKVIKNMRYDDYDPDIIYYFYQKIRYKYNYDNVKKIINKLFDDLVIKMKKISSDIESIIIKVDNYHKFMLENPPNKLIKIEESGRYQYNYGLPKKDLNLIFEKVDNFLDDIHDNMSSIFMEMMDLYTMRRFLDKDYITNGIVYTGAHHSDNYIRILIHFFNFKITHMAYSPIKNPNELTKKIKTILDKNYDDGFLDLFCPPYLIQCSDMTHFPKNFN